MIDYKRDILKAKVGTFIGSMFIGTWTFACCLLLWTAATDRNPVVTAFAQILQDKTLLNQ